MENKNIDKTISKEKRKLAWKMISIPLLGTAVIANMFVITTGTTTMPLINVLLAMGCSFVVLKNINGLYETAVKLEESYKYKEELEKENDVIDVILEEEKVKTKSIQSEKEELEKLKEFLIESKNVDIQKEKQLIKK